MRDLLMVGVTLIVGTVGVIYLLFILLVILVVAGILPALFEGIEWRV